MDIDTALRDVERSLRDFISFMLSEAYGSDWISTCVFGDMVERWSQHREDEATKRGQLGRLDERLISYSSLGDLRSVVNRNWEEVFADAFGDKNRFLTFMDILIEARDPDAHRRELSTARKHLVVGISGEIRAAMVRYRADRDSSSDDYYSRIEAVSDNLGNTWSVDQRQSYLEVDKVLRVGDEVELVVSAADPFGEELQYEFRTSGDGIENNSGWIDENRWTFLIGEAEVKPRVQLIARVRSPRKYLRVPGAHDDSVSFIYRVTPPRYDPEAGGYRTD